MGKVSLQHCHLTVVGMSPFLALYGCQVPPLLVMKWIQQPTRGLIKLLSHDAIWLELKSHLQPAQQRMQQFANRHRRDINYNIVEHVVMKLRSYRQQSLWIRLKEKLAPRYFCPLNYCSTLDRLRVNWSFPQLLAFMTSVMFHNWNKLSVDMSIAQLFLTSSRIEASIVPSNSFNFCVAIEVWRGKDEDYLFFIYSGIGLEIEGRAKGISNFLSH